MKTICPYCDYQNKDEPLSIPLMEVVHEDNLPIEDYILWMQRLMEVHHRQFGLRAYRGVKVHIGRKHKGKYNNPTFKLNNKEKAILDKVTK